MSAASRHGDLAAAMRRALQPQRFPVRRDVELSAGVAPAGGHVSFHDHHWLDRTVLAVSAVRIEGHGIEAVLAAICFRELLRAALTVESEPQAALARCLEVSRPPGLAAAILRLDAGDGTLAQATVGEARVETPAGGGALAPGSVVWIAAGDVAPPRAASVPVEGLDALVGPAVERAGSGCAVALLFKATARAAANTTFAVPNDPAEIPLLLEKVQRFLARADVREEDAAGVDVALDEVLANAISYAFADGHAHEILVELALEAGRLTIGVRDDGAPFDPLGIPPPDLSGDIDQRQVGGLGMHFVRTVMDEVGYERSGGWNVLTLRKALAHSDRLQEARP